MDASRPADGLIRPAELTTSRATAWSAWTTSDCRPTPVLGEVRRAFQYAQLRLASARLTHCMRWLGAAVRAHSIAIEHARTRTAFGSPIGEHQGVGFMLANSEIAFQQCRLAIWHREG